MGRHLEFDKEEALQAAMFLFWKQGYESTSVDDLVQATGASRYGLYANFGDKHALFVQSLKLYATLLRKGPLAPLLKTDASLEEVRQFFMQFMQDKHKAPTHGCLICSTMGELPLDEGSLEEEVQAYLATLTRLLGKALKHACECGELDADFNPRAFSQMAVATLVGSFSMSKSDVGRPYAKRALRALLAQL